MLLDFAENTMNFQAPILPFDLEEHVKSYRYDEEKFRPLRNEIAEKIIAYDKKPQDSKVEGYGHFLYHHLVRTSKRLEEFMTYMGYDADVAKKVSAAFVLHDAGKILQDIAVWEHTAEKPDAEKKAIRAEHTTLGKKVLFDTIDELGLTLTNDDREHIKTIVYLMEAHHERINGIGPLGYNGSQMHEILKMATILDEIDGKIKLDHESLDGIFNDIRTRHKDKFDPDLVEACHRFCRQYGHYADLSAILTQTHSL